MRIFEVDDNSRQRSPSLYSERISSFVQTLQSTAFCVLELSMCKRCRPLWFLTCCWCKEDFNDSCAATACALSQCNWFAAFVVFFSFLGNVSRQTCIDGPWILLYSMVYLKLLISPNKDEILCCVWYCASFALQSNSVVTVLVGKWYCNLVIWDLELKVCGSVDTQLIVESTCYGFHTITSLTQMIQIRGVLWSGS